MQLNVSDTPCGQSWMNDREQQLTPRSLLWEPGQAEIIMSLLYLE